MLIKTKLFILNAFNPEWLRTSANDFGTKRILILESTRNLRSNFSAIFFLIRDFTLVTEKNRPKSLNYLLYNWAMIGRKERTKSPTDFFLKAFGGKSE